jgi:hypothetical protein
MKDMYEKAHLVLAAIRLLEHRHREPPSVEKVCEMLAFSLEQGYRVCRKLHETTAVEMVDGPYGNRLFIKDHLKLEDLPKENREASLREELEKFRSSRKNLTEAIESFQARKQKEKRKLFSEIEEKLKKGEVK